MPHNIRILMSKPGLDGHDIGAKVVIRALRDAGMEVIYTGLRQSPAQIATAAVQEDVDIVGLSVLSGAHVDLTKQTIKALGDLKATDIAVVVGGVIPANDRERLLKLGAAAVLASDSTLAEVVEKVTAVARDRRAANAQWKT